MPGSSRTHLGMCWWDRFGRVETGPLVRDVFYDAWWYDEAKAERVRRFLAEGAAEAAD